MVLNAVVMLEIAPGQTSGTSILQLHLIYDSFLLILCAHVGWPHSGDCCHWCRCRCEIFPQKRGGTPLHHACTRSGVEVLLALIAAGADVDATNVCSICILCSYAVCVAIFAHIRFTAFRCILSWFTLNPRIHTHARARALTCPCELGRLTAIPRL
jgi:hypothetical protein